MSRIALVTDSTSDLPENIIETMGISVIPLNVHFGDEVYKDQLDIFPEEFFSKLETNPDMPRSSQPAPGEFLEVYNRLIREGYESIISLHISSKLSGTVGSAELAKKMCGNADIRVIDSQSVSLGLGLAVVEAAKAIAAGASADRTVEIVLERIAGSRVLFTVDTLEYLQKNGRIGKAAAFLGTLLSIKPILAVADGVVGPFEKIRGRNKAIRRIVEAVVQDLKLTAVKKTVGVIHSLDPESAARLKGELLETGLVEDVIVGEVGSVVGAHAGPGAIGIAY